MDNLMTLQEEVYKSVSDVPRSMFDLMRSISLFIPDNHDLAASARSCLERMKFGAPEQQVFFFSLFLEDLHEDLHGHLNAGDIKNVPLWATVICLLSSGGSPDTVDLLKGLGHE